MSASPKPAVSLQTIFERPEGGVVGLVDALLKACSEGELRLDWHADHCRIRDGNTSVTLLQVPLRKSVFRAMLARIAVLCNERIPNSVSPYGGEGELSVEATSGGGIAVKFTNTPSEQSLEFRRHP